MYVYGNVDICFFEGRCIVDFIFCYGDNIIMRLESVNDFYFVFGGGVGKDSGVI